MYNNVRDPQPVIPFLFEFVVNIVSFHDVIVLTDVT